MARRRLKSSSEAKHRATPVKQPSFTGRHYLQAIAAWHDATSTSSGGSTASPVQRRERAKAHFKKLEQGSISVWAAYDGKTLVGLVSAEATSEYRTRNGTGRPWAIGHLVVRASHRRKGVGGALVRLAAALLLAGNQQCAEVYAAVHADDE